jgi:hypothetical protein
MDGGQRHQHLHRRAVGIGDDAARAVVIVKLTLKQASWRM